MTRIGWLIAFCIIGMFGCQRIDNPQDSDELSYLYQTWSHSSEEDTPDQSVYRTKSYNFPSSGLRQSFTFTEDNVQIVTVTNNRKTEYKGNYTVVMNGNSVKELTINYTPAGQRVPTALKYEVKLLAKDLLLLRLQ